MDPEKRRCERFGLGAAVEFFVDADVIQASLTDVSQTGVSFSTSEPLRILMRITVAGDQEEREAELLWVHRTPEGAFRYGLRFTSDEPAPKPELAE
jgi:hypothetical protein